MPELLYIRIDSQGGYTFAFHSPPNRFGGVLRAEGKLLHRIILYIRLLSNRLVSFRSIF